MAQDASAFVWSFENGLLSLHCPTEPFAPRSANTMRLYRAISVDERWDGSILGHNESEIDSKTANVVDGSGIRDMVSIDSVYDPHAVLTQLAAFCHEYDGRGGALIDADRKMCLQRIAPLFGYTWRENGGLTPMPCDPDLCVLDPLSRPEDFEAAGDVQTHGKTYADALTQLAHNGVAFLPRPVLSGEEVDVVLAAVQEYLDAAQNETNGVTETGDIVFMDATASSHRSYRINRLLNKGRIFETLLQHPVLVNLAKSYLGSDVKYHDMAFYSLAAGESHGDWHVDAHWARPGYRMTVGRRRVKYFLWLDDFTAENGATHFVRDSASYIAHPDFAYLQMQESRRTMDELRRQHGGDAAAPLPWPWPEDVVQPTGVRGLGVMYDHFTLHASGANRSPAPRRLLSIDFVQAGFVDDSYGFLTKPSVAAEVLTRQSSSFVQLTQDFLVDASLDKNARSQ